MTKLTATNQDLEPDRIERLNNVLDNAFDGSKVVSMHDHKGSLVVTWDYQPTTAELKLIKDAWHWNNEIEITHVVKP